MKIIPKLKFYAPAVALLSLGTLIVLGGTVNSGSSSESKLGKHTEMERIAQDIHATPNVLEGAVTINKTLPVPKGVLMVFTDSNLKEAATFGEINQDGSYFINNIPEGQVRLVLRPDTETIVKTMGIPKNDRNLDPRSKRRKGKEGAGSSDEANSRMDPSYLTGFSGETRVLLVGAMSKYGNPRSENAFKTTVAEGVNHVDIDLKVP